jgi:hypothetical protein
LTPIVFRGVPQNKSSNEKTIQRLGESRSHQRFSRIGHRRFFHSLAVVPVDAQQVNGEPGSRSATETINDRFAAGACSAVWC